MNSLLFKEVNKKNTRQKPCERLRRLQDFQIGIDWDELVDIVFMHYLKSGIGRLVSPTETMLKVYFLQIRYGMSALYIEKALIEVDVLREFALVIDIIPDAASIEAFEILLQDKNLTEQIKKKFTLKI